MKRSARCDDLGLDVSPTPRRSFSPRTIFDIRSATVDLPTLRRKYDLDEIEVRLLVFAENVDVYGRVAE